jgi:Centrosome microtubule-binding domain of Cep57
MYLELAEQYGAMDPASNALKRNVLADHLREIIDILERKGDQIAALYDSLKLRKGVHGVVEGVRLSHQQAVRGKTRART